MKEPTAAEERVKSNMVTTSADRFGKLKPTVSDDRKNRFCTKGCQSRKKEKEKEQEDNRNKCSGTRRHGSELLDDKVICEILGKLPVRSLVQFKCVCKPWQLIIEKDPYFLGLHLAHSKTRPKFFAVLGRPCRRALLVTADYLCSDEGSGTAAIDIHHNIRRIDVPYSMDMFFPVKYFGSLDGLVGFYKRCGYSGICLSNVCTQETTPCINSTFVRKFKPNRRNTIVFANCQLGFDPNIKRHKVICIGCIGYSSSQPPYMFCEVLTVGDHEWRIVGDVASNLVSRLSPQGISVYSNGSIYYKSPSFMKSGHLDNDKIQVFDVALEKFRAIAIAIPDFILYHPRDIDDAIVDPVSLLEMDGQLAISCRINSYVVKLWLYDDDGGGVRSKNGWREIIIELPFVWDRDKWLTFLSGAPKNEIIIKSAQLFAGDRTKICSVSYHSYNWKKKTFIDIKINGIPSKFGRLFNPHFEAIFTESLFSIQ